MDSEYGTELYEWTILFKTYDKWFNLTMCRSGSDTTHTRNNLLDKYIDYNERICDNKWREEVIMLNYIGILGKRNKFKISSDCFIENIYIPIILEFKKNICSKICNITQLFRNHKKFPNPNLWIGEFILSRDIYRRIFQDSYVITNMDSVPDNTYMILNCKMRQYGISVSTPKLENNGMVNCSYRFIKCVKCCKKVVKFERYMGNIEDEQKQTGQVRREEIQNIIVLPNLKNDSDYLYFSKICRYGLIFDNFETIEKFKKQNWINVYKSTYSVLFT